MRALYWTAGSVCLALAVAGLFLPVVPTTPFLLLASWCFARSSPALHAMLRRSPLFGPLLLDWERHHGIRPHVKVSAIGMLVLAVGFSLWLGSLSTWLSVLVVALAGLGAFVILKLRTIRDDSSD